MSRGFISIVFLLTLSVCTVFSEPCVEKSSGQNGVCTTIYDCLEKFVSFVISGEEPQFCNSKNRTICCPEEIVTTTMKPDRISEEKCGEYTTKIFATINVVDTHGKSTDILDLTCGKGDAIYYGESTEEKEFPHMALIGYGEGRFEDYKCGGSLISEQWVLSAAHCSHDQSFGRAKSGYVDHDIVLFKVNKPVTFNRHILPICLQKSEDIPSTVIATGWGKTENTTGMSSILMKVTLDHLPISSCQNYFEDEDEFVDTDFSNIVCAGSQQGKDTCKGDSGSPLQDHNRDHHCMYTVIGITAHGSSFCGKSANGAIYTKVFKYLDWIEGIVWPGE